MFYTKTSTMSIDSGGPVYAISDQTKIAVRFKRVEF